MLEKISKISRIKKIFSNKEKNLKKEDDSLRKKRKLDTEFGDNLNEKMMENEDVTTSSKDDDMPAYSLSLTAIKPTHSLYYEKKADITKAQQLACKKQ